MPLPISYSSTLTVGTSRDLEAVLRSLEQALRLRGVGIVDRRNNTLAFGGVSLDRTSVDLFTPIDGGTIAAECERGQIRMLYRLSFLRFFLISLLGCLTLFLVLSVENGPIAYQDAVLKAILLWFGIVMVAYITTIYRFRVFLAAIAS